MAKWGAPGSEERRTYYREYQKRRRAERPDVREYHRQWNKANAGRVKVNAARKIAECREIIRKAKEKPCADCAVEYPSYVMDFDHVRGQKIAHIGSGRFQSAPHKLRAEIAKCDVVCANCHREREHQKRERPSYSSGECGMNMADMMEFQ